jgi:cell division protease FtsH
MSNQNKITVDYDELSKKILATVGAKNVVVPYVGRIDKIRQSNLADAVANISVHECGHAVAYMILTGMAPLQLKSKVASSYAGGFTFPHQIHETKDNIINKVKIFLAGGIAEEIIFGKGHASIGRSNDREQATVLVMDYVRKYGFDDEFQANYGMDFYPNRMDMSVTDVDVEKMLTRLVADTKEILSNNLAMLKDLSIALCDAGSLEAKEVAVFAKKHNISVLVREEGYLHIADYAKKLK